MAGLLIVYTQTLLVAHAQGVLRGRVLDAGTLEPLHSATVFHVQTKGGRSTGMDGIFSLDRIQDGDSIIVSYVGYETRRLRVSAMHFQKRLDVLLKPGTLTADDVLVTASHNLKADAGMSVFRLAPAQLDAMPTFLGQRDLLKSLHFLPGVQSGNEGTSGVFIRGGSSDQTLILLDGVPLFQAFHSAGFVSVFSSSDLQSGALYTGAFPARFGGRLAGVIDLQVKEGNRTRLAGDVEAGLVSSELHLEIPVKKADGSFLVSGRRSNLINTMGFIGLTEPQLLPATDFYDLLLKGTASVAKNGKLSLSLFDAADNLSDSFTTTDQIPADVPIRFRNTTRYRVGWTNSFVNSQYSQPFGNGWYGKIRAYYVRFANRTREEQEILRTRLGDSRVIAYSKTENTSGIASASFGADVIKSFGSRLNVEAGALLSRSWFNTGNVSFASRDLDSLSNATNLGGERPVMSNELEGYVSADYRYGPIETVIGLRMTALLIEGHSYLRPQPRLSTRARLTENFSIKASSSIMTQAVHAAAAAGPGVTTDYWVPSAAGFKPQFSWISAFGAVWTPSPKWEFTAEVYRRRMNRVVEFRQGASFFVPGATWYDHLVQGNGESRGLELLLKKTSGRFRTAIAYTLSESTRSFSTLNFGRTFPFKYDRTHNLSATGSLQVNRILEVTAAYTLYSGYLLTVPEHLFAYSSFSPVQSPGPGYETRYFPVRNNYRMPLYHRMDLAAVATVPTKWGRPRLRAGLYNAYNRENPVYAIPGVRNGLPGMVMFNLFPVVPFIALGGTF